MTRRTNLPAIEGEFGPAMQALTPTKRAFVMAKVFNGLDSAAAYRATGYTGPHASSIGWQLAHDPAVQDAILEEGRKLIRSEGPKSILTLVAIRDDKTVKPEVRAKCATEILNRAGFNAVTEHHEHLHQHVSNEEADRRILALCAEMGMAPDEAKKMLIAPAEFERSADGVYTLAAEPRELSTDPHAVYQRDTRRRRADMTPEEVEADKLRIRNARRERLRAERRVADARRNGEVTDVVETADEPVEW